MKLKQINILWILIVILVVALIFSVKACNSNKQKNEDISNVIEILSDSLQTSRNSLGEHEAKIKIIEASSAKAFTDLKIKNLEILALQELTKENIKNLTSASIIKTETIIKENSPSKIIEYKTINDTIYPTYHSKINKDGWIVGDITANKDSVYSNFKIKNEYDVVFKKEKGVSYAIVTNKNPFTETTSLKTFNVQAPKQKKFGIGFVAGYGMTGEGTLKPFIGAGVSYNIIRF